MDTSRAYIVATSALFYPRPGAVACRSNEWAEGYVYSSYRRHELYHRDIVGHIIDQAQMESPIQRGIKLALSTDRAAEIWYNCVSEFSTRSLTGASDKLPAIAGLANMFHRPKLGAYMAGLWEHDLFRGMS